MEFIIQLRATQYHDWYEAAYFIHGKRDARIFNNKKSAEKMRNTLIQMKRTTKRNSKVIECPAGCRII